MNARIVSFINMKGGVGKTTLCIGIGEYLAHNEDKKILLIDIDPQFNTTQSLMNEYNMEETYLNEYYNKKNIRKIFTTPNTISEKPEIPKKEEVIVELDENIHIVPGTINLIFEDSKESGKIRRVKKFIDENKLREIYDYIFIDCPPTISLYTDAALIASDYYLVPNRVDRYSILGIKLLKQVIDRLKNDLDLAIKPLGIVYTMIASSTLKTNNLKAKFEEDEMVQEIGLFSNSTSYVNDLLVGYQGNISTKYKKSREDIIPLSNEFMERIDNYEK